MGNRLTKIYTRTGDGGETGLGNGDRVAKDHARIHAIGTVDELNSAIGLVLTEELPELVEAVLTRSQHHLFDLGGELSVPGFALIEERHVQGLEQALDALNELLPPLKEFVLPGGNRAAAQCHLARAICRRAERSVVSLHRSEQVRAPVMHYLNRLSDLLFVGARLCARQHGADEVLWQRDQ